MAVTTEELNNVRKKLEASLGDNVKPYFHLMKLWFQLKSTKAEFDAATRKLLSRDQIRLHNEFLMCLFNRCQNFAAINAPPPKTSHSDNKVNRRAKVKRRNRSDKGNFEPADFADYIYIPSAVPSNAFEEPLRYSAQELFLPDISLILGRLMISAWELGLEGADENAAKFVVIAVQHFLKNVLMGILSRRKGYKLREGRVMYNLGSVVPNPWLRNTANMMVDNTSSCLSESEDEEEKLEEIPPPQKLTLDEIEQKAAYEIACSNDNVVHYPVTPFQMLEAIQVFYFLRSVQ
ncbi:Transcriptional adapter 1 [Blattella germanica]|nr:Transcriptional adapter 1 [Blattella germanica]